ncbi:hypothetical protein VN97_g3149 [Penicillium thymicola]|uniref:Uncharacterized protein n=1 Tax=Penicillium thymicola TaxID=293382 RepID=A0AAI9TP82_PENTH|nr:hypothetical protein VN97_g3149 [Penicillium thymicola]
MSTQYLLANLRNRPDGRPSIDFGSLSARESDPVKMPHEITRLFSSDYCTSTSTTLEAEESEVYWKALSRNKRAAGILEHFLNGEQAAAHPSVYLQDRARLRLCEEAILVGAPRGTATRTREGIASYDKMEFLFPESRQRKSIQMLHVSCPSLQPGATLLDSHSGSVHDSITILSGMCLFTRKILNSTTTNGCLDGQKLRHMSPTLYEMECIARLSAIIADVTTLTQSNFGEDNHPAVNISDACSLEEAIDWTEAIKLRRQQLASVLKKAVWHELGQRQVAHKSTLKAIQISPESTVVDELIKETLQLSGRNSIRCSGTATNHTLSEISGFSMYFKFRPALLKAIPCQEAPSCKAPACEQPNLRRGQRQCLPQLPLIISLDDRAERKIYSQAHSLLLRLSRSSNQLVNPTLVQLYMLRRVYIDGNKDGQRLYWHDPSPVLPLLEGTKEQQRRDARNHDHHRRELQQTDILTELYGRECSANIQGWFKEAGLC